MRAAVFPVGIDVEAIAAQAEAAGEVAPACGGCSDSIARPRLLIGVDRLDYSKGLPAAVRGLSRICSSIIRETRGRTVFMQIAPPSRADVPEYPESAATLEAAAGHINGRFAEFDWTPLRYLNKSFNHRILTGLLSGGADRRW